MKRLAALHAWPRVLQAPADGRLDDRVEVVGVEHEERVRAAELEHDLLEVAAGDLGHRGARAARSRSATRPARAGRR